MVGGVGDPHRLLGIRVRSVHDPRQELGRQHPRGGAIDHGFVDLLVLHLLHQRAEGGRVGQLHVDPGQQGLAGGVRGVPGHGMSLLELRDAEVVGDHEPREGPLAPEHLLEQEAALVRGHAVDLVVGGHDRVDPRLLHRGLEGLEVLLAQDPLAEEDGGGIDPPFVRPMAREVLGGGEHAAGPQRQALALVAANRGHPQPGGEIGVFAVGLFGAAPARIAGEVEDGRQHLLDAPRSRFPRGHRHDALEEVHVPGAGEADGHGEVRRPRSHEAVDRFLVEHGGDAEPRALDQELLHRVDVGHGLSRPAARSARHRDLARSRHLAHAVREHRLRLRGVEDPPLVLEGRLLLPHAAELGDLLLEGHPPQEILHPGLHREGLVAPGCRFRGGRRGGKGREAQEGERERTLGRRHGCFSLDRGPRS